jgi:DNA invertase Pin-like site-specific DNA recombinase
MMERQIRRAQKYCDSQGLNLQERTTLMDLGVSAFKGDHRRFGELGRFLAAVREDRVPRGSYLIIESLDRFSREQVMDILPEFIDLLNAGIIVVTLTDERQHRRENYASDWTQLMFSIVSFARANEESSRKRDHQEQNWIRFRERAQKGEIVTGRIPHWLEISQDERGKKTFKQCPDRVALVTRIFEELAGGIGRGTIAKRLNEEGVPPFGKGDGWHGGTVQKLTTNRAVLGEYQPQKLIQVDVNGVTRTRREPVGDPIRNYYPWIVSDELWLRAQKASRSRRSNPTEQAVSNSAGRIGKYYSNLFRAFAKCSECGSKMVYKDGSPRGLPALHCSKSRRGLCGNKTKYYYEPLESAVLRWVHDLDLTDAMPDEGRALERQIATRTVERDGFTAKSRRLLQEFLDVEIKVEAVTKIAVDLQLRIDRLDAEIAGIQHRLDDLRANLDHSGRQDAIRSLQQKLRAASTSERFALRAKVALALTEVIERMSFRSDGTVVAQIRNLPRLYIFWEGKLHQIATFSTDVLPGGLEEELVKSTEPSMFWTWHVFEPAGDEKSV